MSITPEIRRASIKSIHSFLFTIASRHNSNYSLSTQVNIPHKKSKTTINVSLECS